MASEICTSWICYGWRSHLADTFRQALAMKYQPVLLWSLYVQSVAGHLHALQTRFGSAKVRPIQEALHEFSLVTSEPTFPDVY